MNVKHYRRLWAYLDKRAKRLATVAMIFTIVTSLMEAVGVGGLVLVMRLTEGATVEEHLPWLATLRSVLGIRDYVDFAILLCLSVAVFYIVKNGFLLFTSWLQTHFGARARILVTGRLITWYFNRPFVEHLGEKPSDVVYLLSQSSEEGVIQGIVPGLVVVTETLAVIAILTVAFTFYPLATLLFLLVLAALPGAIYILYVHKRTRAIGVAGLEARQTMHDALLQGLGSLREIRALEKESYFVARFHRFLERCADLRAYELILLKLMPPMVECFVALGVTLAAVVAITRGDGTGAALPMITLFGAASLRLLPSIFRMAQAMQLLAVARAPLGRVLDELDRADVRQRASEAPKAPFQSLSLENVSFQYPGTSGNVLSDISLTLRAGESVAIVGPSGAGKSTLIDVLLGILSPTAGDVRVNGDVLEAETARPVRLSYIPQDIFLLHDTLRRNVAFGVPDAEVEDRRLADALDRACLTDVIRGLPEGMDTVLGERGARLSGGQRQRVALARAFYHDTDLLILDEATSALDAETEARISETLDALQGKVARVLITHRLGSVHRCDRIYYLEGGRIVDAGPYAELLARCTPFRRMVQLAQAVPQDAAPMGGEA